MDYSIKPLCIPFKMHHKGFEGQIKEYDILFRSDDSTLDRLIEFISLPFVERVNITFTDDIPIKIIQTANKVKDCIYVRLQPSQTMYIEKLQEADIRFFFDKDLPILNICQLQEAVEVFGVTDVYIMDDLTYNLRQVHEYCADRGVQVRLVLNRIPMSTLTKGSNVKSPMYRPQDTIALGDYYDVFEFDCGDPYDWHKFNVYYDAYFETCNWYGDLAEINEDIKLPNGFPNEFIVPEYTGYKVNCARRCEIEDSPCRKCEQFYDIGEIFVEKGVGFKYPKKKRAQKENLGESE